MLDVEQNRRARKYSSGEIIRRAARSADNRDRLISGKLSEERSGRFEPRGSGRCLDDAKGS